MASLFAICTTIEDTVADPDLQIRGCVWGGGGGGEGGGYPKERGGVPQKNMFGLKIRGWGGGFPGPSPGSATEMHELYDELSVSKTWN